MENTTDNETICQSTMMTEVQENKHGKICQEAHELCTQISRYLLDPKNKCPKPAAQFIGERTDKLLSIIQHACIINAQKSAADINVSSMITAALAPSFNRMTDEISRVATLLNSGKAVKRSSPKAKRDNVVQQVQPQQAETGVDSVVMRNDGMDQNTSAAVSWSTVVSRKNAKGEVARPEPLTGRKTGGNKSGGVNPLIKPKATDKNMKEER